MIQYLLQGFRMSTNPLHKYFRQPAIYIRLPSQGKYYPAGAIEMPPNGEIGVLPMTTMDEVAYRTPDAMFNGAATVSVIQSCVPSIKNAWAVPSMDLDTLMVAIRIASYGHSLETESQCPKCQNEDSYGTDLRTVLDSIRPVNYARPLQMSEIQVTFKPLNYQQMNENSMIQFSQQKSLQVIQLSEDSEESKLKKMGDVLKALTEATTRALSGNIAAVSTPEGTVTNHEHILEWLNNCDRDTFTKIRDFILEIKSTGDIKPMTIECSACSHRYEQELTLDMANFFDHAS